MNDFLQKLKKVVRIMLYGPAISQSDCRKAGPYQLPYNETDYNTLLRVLEVIIQTEAKKISIDVSRYSGILHLRNHFLKIIF